MNVAVMFLFPFMVTSSGVTAPVASPLQPVKLQPVVGAALSVTTVPGA